MALTLPRESIGLWYGMLSLTALAACIELGFSGTIGRIASYYYAGATSVPSLGLSGIQGPMTGPNVGALYGIVTEARRVYRLLAVLNLALATAAACGWVWLLPSSQRLPTQSLVALALLVGGSAVNLSAMFWPSVLQGYMKSAAATSRGLGFLRACLPGRASGAGLVLGGRANRPKPGRALVREALRARLARRPACATVRANWRSFWLTRRVAWHRRVSIGLAGNPLLITSFSFAKRTHGLVCRRR